jgi:hypothetical protein
MKKHDGPALNAEELFAFIKAVAVAAEKRETISEQEFDVTDSQRRPAGPSLPF